MHITLDALSAGCPQPLAREAYFHIILLGLRIVRHCTTLPNPIKWRLKDRILTVGLAWFAKAPEYVVFCDLSTLADELGGHLAGIAFRSRLRLTSYLTFNHTSRLSAKPGSFRKVP